MASIIIDGAPKDLSLQEVWRTLIRAADKLQEKRSFHKETRFATVFVGELLVHPATRSISFLVSFGDRDRVARRYIQLVLNHLERISRERLLQAEKRESSGYTFPKLDLGMA